MAADPPPGSPAPGSGGADGRDEMDARPPFATWRAIYTVVLVALAAQVAFYAALTAIYR